MVHVSILLYTSSIAPTKPLVYINEVELCKNIKGVGERKTKQFSKFIGPNMLPIYNSSLVVKNNLEIKLFSLWKRV